jgi:glycosyltransferase involved in cell wall biosynthesis
MDTKNCECCLITLFDSDDKDNFYNLIPKNIPVYRLRFRHIRDISEWYRLFRLLKKIDSDIVVSSLFFSNTVFRLIKPLFRYRVIIVEQSTYLGKTRVQQITDRLLASITEKIVAVSKMVASFTAEQEGIGAEKFVIIYNGVDVSRLMQEQAQYQREAIRKELGIDEDERVMVNVGRLTPEKNHLALIEGFALFAAAHPAYTLFIVGGGGLMAELAARVAARGLQNKVFLLGLRKDVVRYYTAADFFISTSLREGFGIAHAEAMACGLPLLSTRTSGSDEMITEGVNGYFIDGPDPGSIVAGMEKMALADWAAMSAQARRSVEQFSIERTVKGYEAICSEIITAYR